MSKTEQYVRINTDGTCFVVYNDQSERSLSETMLAELGSKIVTKFERAFESNGMPVTLISAEKINICFVELHQLVLNTKYRIWADGILRPHYTSDPSDPAPSTSAAWIPPSGMKLIFAAQLEPKDGGKTGWATSNSHKCHLFAFNGRVAYRMPLPNLYDNGDICMGQFDGVDQTLSGAFGRALNQFLKSEWNADLLDSSRQNGSDQIFHFTAGESIVDPVIHDEQFDWVRYCPKIATQISKIIGDTL